MGEQYSRIPCKFSTIVYWWRFPQISGSENGFNVTRPPFIGGRWPLKYDWFANVTAPPMRRNGEIIWYGWVVIPPNGRGEICWVGCITPSNHLQLRLSLNISSQNLAQFLLIANIVPKNRKKTFFLWIFVVDKPILDCRIHSTRNTIQPVAVTPATAA